jgi:hypothetical protein
MGDGPSRASSPKYSDLPRRGSYSGSLRLRVERSGRDRGVRTTRDGSPRSPYRSSFRCRVRQGCFDHAIERHLGAALLFQLPRGFEQGHREPMEV